jgi:hypothetical protein
MLDITWSPCNRTVSSSLNGRDAKLWSCDFPSGLLDFVLKLRRTSGSRVPWATTVSFFRGCPMSSFFRALRITICSEEFLAFRICATHDCLAIVERLLSVLDSLAELEIGESWRCVFYRLDMLDRRELYKGDCIQERECKEITSLYTVCNANQRIQARTIGIRHFR